MMLRVISLIALVLCMTKASIGAVVMWNCEVERPVAQSSHVMLDTAATPQPSQSTCVQFPHGHCNFLVASFTSASPAELHRIFVPLPLVEFQSITQSVPIEPPRA